MKRQRKYKMFSIVALMFAVVGLSVGFAAFSKVLTINANATVTPNEEDFKVVTYGFKDQDSLNYFLEYYEISDDLLSDKVGIGYTEVGEEGAAIATTTSITNNLKNTTISNVNVSFNSASIYKYPFIIKNEGKYDAYINLNNCEVQYGEQCTGTLDQELIDEACKNVLAEIYLEDSDYNIIEVTEEEPYYKLSVGEYIYLNLAISPTNKDALLSETYNINFKDFIVNFSTAL